MKCLCSSIVKGSNNGPGQEARLGGGVIAETIRIARWDTKEIVGAQQETSGILVDKFFPLQAGVSAVGLWVHKCHFEGSLLTSTNRKGLRTGTDRLGNLDSSRWQQQISHNVADRSSVAFLSYLEALSRKSNHLSLIRIWIWQFGLYHLIITSNDL